MKVGLIAAAVRVERKYVYVVVPKRKYQRENVFCAQLKLGIWLAVR